MNGKKWLYELCDRILKVDNVTLPNLIANRVIIPELLIHNCTPENIDRHLTALLADSDERQQQLSDYGTVMQLLGTDNCAVNTATRIFNLIKEKKA
jgi:lipid-A-disaccharide synthase